MRWMKRGLIAVAALVILLPVGGLAVNHYVETTQRDRFYATRPMLRAMDDALGPPRRGDLSAMLLARIPVGSDRADALRILGIEGIQCSAVNGPASRTDMVCSPWDRPAHAVPRWQIEIRFGQDDRLAGGRVLALKATE